MHIYLEIKCLLHVLDIWSLTDGAVLGGCGTLRVEPSQRKRTTGTCLGHYNPVPLQVPVSLLAFWLS